jgi:hypothetical protein
MPGQPVLIMLIGPLPGGSRTHWIRDFTAFQLARRTRTVMLMVPVCPESGFLSEDRRYVMSREATVPSAGNAKPCEYRKALRQGRRR